MSYQFPNRYHRSSPEEKEDTNFLSKEPARIQVSNAIADFRNHRDQDVRSWAYNYRHGLLRGGTAFMVVPAPDMPKTTMALDAPTSQGQTITEPAPYKYKVPKLSMIVASSTFRNFLEKNPELAEVKLANPRLTPKAIATVSRFLWAVVEAKHLQGVMFRVTEEAKLGDIEDMLDVHVAMELLGMTRYVSHFSELYKANLSARIPTFSEASAIMKRYRKETEESMGLLEDIMDVFGTHLVFLSNKDMMDAAWKKFVAHDNNRVLQDAMGAVVVKLEKAEAEKLEAAKSQKGKKGKKTKV